MSIDINLPTPVKRGSGYWKFNINLLKDQEFIDHITVFWDSWENEINRYDDIRVWCDLATINLKRIAITHSIKASKRTKSERENFITLLEIEGSKSNSDIKILDSIPSGVKIIDTKAATKISYTHTCKFLRRMKNPQNFSTVFKITWKKNTA